MGGGTAGAAIGWGAYCCCAGGAGCGAGGCAAGAGAVTIAVGGGTTSNLSRFANHTMSHNAVLVNGREQQAAGHKNQPFCGRIIA